MITYLNDSMLSTMVDIDTLKLYTRKGIYYLPTERIIRKPCHVTPNTGVIWNIGTRYIAERYIDKGIEGHLDYVLSNYLVCDSKEELCKEMRSYMGWDNYRYTEETAPPFEVEWLN
jgi:hypothetical protein